MSKTAKALLADIRAPARPATALECLRRDDAQSLVAMLTRGDTHVDDAIHLENSQGVAMDLTLLTTAVVTNSLACFEALLRHGANPNGHPGAYNDTTAVCFVLRFYQGDLDALRQFCETNVFCGGVRTVGAARMFEYVKLALMFGSDPTHLDLDNSRAISWAPTLDALVLMLEWTKANVPMTNASRISILESVSYALDDLAGSEELRAFDPVDLSVAVFDWAFDLIEADACDEEFTAELRKELLDRWACVRDDGALFTFSESFRVQIIGGLRRRVSRRLVGVLTQVVVLFSAARQTREK